MRNRLLVLFFIILFTFSAAGQNFYQSDSLSYPASTDLPVSHPKNILKPSALILGTNIAMWANYRFILHSDFSYINLQTIKNNFIKGFTWDYDRLLTNFVGHPYAGGVYHGAARAFGFNFWQSYIFDFAGSLQWELFMENQLPSTNDLIATSVGGLCLGEPFYRISDMLINNQSKGIERVGREFLITLLSPAAQLKRAFKGEMWKVNASRGNTIPIPEYDLSMTLGYRILSANYLFDSKIMNRMMNYGIDFSYGNQFDGDNEKPFDYFEIYGSGNFFSKQQIVDKVSVLGSLFTQQIDLKKNTHLVYGVFQHLNYFRTDTDSTNNIYRNYKVAEGASAGPGLMCQTLLTKNIRFTASAFLSGILMGGYQTDYYRDINRDYSYGSGFSPKLSCELQMFDKFQLNFEYQNFRLFCWEDYNPAQNGFKHDAQGDTGSGNLSVYNFNLSYLINNHILLTAQSGVFNRISTYRYFDTVKFSVFENLLSVGYKF